MRRRELIVGVLAAAISAASAGAQPSSRMPRIGYLASGHSANLDALHEGLRHLGWVVGRNLTVEYRWSGDNDDMLPGLAADLVRLGVDLIVTPADTYAGAAVGASG